MNSQVESFGKPLVQALREVPAPAGTEVVLRIASRGVCHSDVRMHDGFDLGGGHRLDWRAPCSRRAPWATRSRDWWPPSGLDAQGCRSATGASPIPGSAAQPRAVRGGAGAPVHHAAGAGVARDGGFASHVVVPHPRYLVDHGAIPDEQACTMPAPD